MVWVAQGGLGDPVVALGDFVVVRFLGGLCCDVH